MNKVTDVYREIFAIQVNRCGLQIIPSWATCSPQAVCVFETPALDEDNAGM